MCYKHILKSINNNTQGCAPQKLRGVQHVKSKVASLWFLRKNVRLSSQPEQKLGSTVCTQTDLQTD